jgi:hypothetical protein
MQDNVEFDDAGLAPRIGLTYNGENLGVFKLHFGRYYEYVGTGDYNNYARTITTDQYRMSSEDIGSGPEAMYLHSEGTLGYNPDYNKDMKMEYNDEILVAWEKEVIWSTVLEATFIYRFINTSYQEDINAIFENEQFVDYKFPDYNTIWQRTFYTGDARRTKFNYRGLQFNLRRNFTGIWGMMANYSFHWRTYRKLAFDPTDPDQYVYPDPSSLDMENYGVRWSFHFSLFFRLPANFVISSFISGQSGVYVGDRTGDYDVNESAPTVTLSNGRRTSDILWSAQNSYYVNRKWGSQGRYTDDIWSVNLRLSWTLRFERVNVEFLFDAFNIFNWAAYTSYQSVDIRHEYYDQKTNPQTPRALQLGLKVSF